MTIQGIAGARTGPTGPFGSGATRQSRYRARKRLSPLRGDVGPSGGIQVDRMGPPPGGGHGPIYAGGPGWQGLNPSPTALPDQGPNPFEDSAQPPPAQPAEEARVGNPFTSPASAAPRLGQALGASSPAQTQAGPLRGWAAIRAMLRPLQRWNPFR